MVCHEREIRAREWRFPQEGQVGERTVQTVTLNSEEEHRKGGEKGNEVFVQVETENQYKISGSRR